MPDHRPTPAGDQWVYCMSFVHYITKQRVTRKDGRPFAFRVRK